jgi:hypothetical protein
VGEPEMGVVTTRPPRTPWSGRCREPEKFHGNGLSAAQTRGIFPAPFITATPAGLNGTGASFVRRRHTPGLVLSISGFFLPARKTR